MFLWQNMGGISKLKAWLFLTCHDSKNIFLSFSVKVAIPGNGNLYHFSVSKMSDFFRQLKLSEDTVKVCAKAKIDGKKFSKLNEADLERYGLMHPVVVHFRHSTHKKTPTFML